MYKKYFDEYYVSDEELKLMICRIIESLSVFSPDDFNVELLNYISLEQSSESPPKAHFFHLIEN